MASVHSPVRKFLKPILFKLFGKSLYPWFQYKAKLRDIEQKLVEEKEMELLPFFINKDSEAIDIGANYAYYTVRMAQTCRKVYAFEPIPFTHKVCRMILDHYKFKNVTLYQKGVGEKNEVHKFSVPIMDFGAISAGQAHFGERNDNLDGKEKHVTYKKTEVIDCEVVALDLLPEAFNKISFIKIDIEGAEYFALNGMRNLIEKFKPVILVEINPFFLEGFGLSEFQMKKVILSLKYKTFMYDDIKRKLVPWEQNYIEANYIIIHEDKLSEFKNIIDNEK